MLCENPIYAIRKDTKGKLYFLTLKDIERIENNEIIFVDILKKDTSSKRPWLATYPVIKIPCGKCLMCRYEHSEEWSVRCVLEAEKYVSNLFVTLTYNPENEPKCGADKKVLSKFMHDLRQYFQRKQNHVGIRFFGCGEYGKKAKRPHYHVLLFNCPPFGDEKEHSKSQGRFLYKSKILENIWKKGNCTIGTVTKQSAAYVASCFLKSFDLTLPKNLKPVFINMSRKKGIGLDYLTENIENIMKTDKVILPNGKTAELPHYYNKKLKELIGNERYETEFTKPRADNAKLFIKETELRTGLTKEELIKQRIERIKKKIKQSERNFDDSD